MPDELVFWYRNYRGEEGYRRVRPISLRFGVSEWHAEPQWLLKAEDLEKGSEREFAMRDVKNVVGHHKILCSVFVTSSGEVT